MKGFLSSFRLFRLVAHLFLPPPLMHTTSAIERVMLVMSKSFTQIIIDFPTQFVVRLRIASIYDENDKIGDTRLLQATLIM